MNAAGDSTSQYILITPQGKTDLFTDTQIMPINLLFVILSSDASNMEPGPYITVHRLADPDRT
jgi:hypothetical protein